MVPGRCIGNLQAGGAALLIDGLVVVEELSGPVLFLVTQGHEDGKEGSEEKDAQADPEGNDVSEQGTEMKINPA